MIKGRFVKEIKYIRPLRTLKQSILQVNKNSSHVQEFLQVFAYCKWKRVRRYLITFSEKFESETKAKAWERNRCHGNRKQRSYVRMNRRYESIIDTNV